MLRFARMPASVSAKFASRMWFAQRTYRTSPENLWSAITKRQRIESWFGKVSDDFKRGGRFSIEGNTDGDIIA
jgi:uncharacterized protein YndB with AHSA1/START domain